MIDAVVFDYDDTLVETLPARIEAMRRTFAQAGFTMCDAAAFVHASRGIPLQTALDGFASGQGQRLNLTAIYRSFYWHKEVGLINLYDGVRDLLDGLQDRQIPIGLLTSKVREIIVDGRRAGAAVDLEDLGIDGHFAHAIGVEDVTYPKPHPEGLERLLRQMGQRPEQTLVVGDSWTDLEAAHNGGCWSCLATWGLNNPAEQLAKVGPDFIAAQPSDVLKMVLNDK